MNPVLPFLGALFLQLVLAFFTMEDARSRGHNSAGWFLFVVAFGIFAVLIYLLTRGQKLSKSEMAEMRKDRRDWEPIVIGYCWTLVAVAVLLFLIDLVR
ncbi:hypothetical protein PNP85_01910 [Halobacterium salinarum]|uniref:hypothetical protein n=1 Tax=Halobacterium salinarum TaxID=2242 RepID=UPI002557086E|nr:hypothetical protein [Halobacterium salinarum]MDL0138265.1 hypothetical protein [Halobacterium salinarum]